jgi:hypothetical protein
VELGLSSLGKPKAITRLPAKKQGYRLIPDTLQQTTQVGRQSGVEFQNLPRPGMLKSQLCGMEKVSPGLAVLLYKLGVSTLTVHIVPHDGMADRSKVDSNLVRSTGPDLDFQE